MSFAIGPDVDRLPTCRATLGSALGILARPGATRNFGIACIDADFDAFAVRLGASPQRGAFAVFAPEPLRSSLDGTLQVIDVTYVPTASSMEPDPFTVVAENAPGGVSETPMAIVPTALPENVSAPADGSAASGTATSRRS